MLIDVYDEAREPIPDAVDFLYQLLRDRDKKASISHKTMPSKEEHERFVRSCPYRYWYLIKQETWVGTVSATMNNEIGIMLAKPFQGCGIGPAALLDFISKHEPLPAIPSLRVGAWLANIAPSNGRSKRMFQRLGFRKVQETYQRG